MRPDFRQVVNPLSVSNLEEHKMARTSTYLDFPHTTEAAFNFYKSVFGTEFSTPFSRYQDIPGQPGQPPLSEAGKNLVMHVALPILGRYVQMGTDASESTGFTLKQGNTVYISLEPDTLTESDRLFKLLSTGGKVKMQLPDMSWRAYFGSLTDKFGVQWMFNCESKA
jgi:PhnB protein